MWNVLLQKMKSFFSESILPIKTRLQILWKKDGMSLSFFDIIPFSTYLSNNGSNTLNEILFKNSFFYFLIRRNFDCMVTSIRHIINVSLDYEKFVIEKIKCLTPTPHPTSRNIDSVMIFF